MDKSLTKQQINLIAETLADVLKDRELCWEELVCLINTQLEKLDLN